MESIILTTQNGDSFSVEVVRYFECNGKNYLIFTTNEKDDQGYVKLYAVRIEDEGGNATATNIVDENEWMTVKTMIQTIINTIRNGGEIAFDLDISPLTSLKATSSRVFRLQDSLTKVLASNKKPRQEITALPVEESIEKTIEQPLPEVEPVLPTSPQQSSSEIEELRKEVERLTTENMLYRAKIEAIQELIGQD